MDLARYTNNRLSKQAAALQQVISHGLDANKRFRRSVECLAEGSLTPGQVCDIFKSQAQLNQANAAWNSLASLSLIHNNRRLGHLLVQSAEQEKKISELGYQLAIHREVVGRLLGTAIAVSKRLRLLTNHQRTTAAALKVIRTEIALAKWSQQKRSFGTATADTFNSVVRSTLRLGVLALMCDAILQLSQIPSVLKLAASLLPNRTLALRLYRGSRIALVLALMVLLRDRYCQAATMLGYILRNK